MPGTDFWSHVFSDLGTALQAAFFPCFAFELIWHLGLHCPSKTPGSLNPPPPPPGSGDAKEESGEGIIRRGAGAPEGGGWWAFLFLGLGFGV